MGKTGGSCTCPKAGLTAQHSTRAHSWMRGSAPSPGMMVSLARLLPTVPCSCHGKPSRGHPAIWQTGTLGMWSLHSALIQPRLEDSAAAEGVWLWGQRGRTAPKGYTSPFPASRDPGRGAPFQALLH